MAAIAPCADFSKIAAGDPDTWLPSVCLQRRASNGQTVNLQDRNSKKGIRSGCWDVALDNAHGYVHQHRGNGRRHSRDVARRAQLISRPEHLKALASPIRHDIVDRLSAMGPLSVRDLARVLGRKPTAIYRHLIILERLGLVLATATNGARGRPAMLYRTAPSLARGAGPSRIKGSRAPMVKIASAMARQAARDYSAAFQSSGSMVEGPRRNHGFFELITSPSPKKLARINALLDDLAQLMWTPDEKPGRPIRVTWFMSPSSKTSKRMAKGSRADDERAGVKPSRAQIVSFTGRRAGNGVPAGRIRSGTLRHVSAA